MRRLAVLFLVCALILMNGCATSHKKKTKKPRKPPAQTTPETRKPPVPSGGEENGAARTASNVLVEDGRKAMNQGSFDHAADLFQEAVTIDPHNGAAYYHLASAKLKSGDRDVSDLIEKARSLLANDADWISRLDALEEEAKQTPP